MSIDDSVRESAGGGAPAGSIRTADPEVAGGPGGANPPVNPEPEVNPETWVLSGDDQPLPEPPVPGGSGVPPDDLVTRLLCAATYLRDSFADAVARDLLWPSLVAMGPLWQVDASRLLQHARRARAARRARDRRLAAVVGCLLLTVLVWGGLSLSHPMNPIAGAILALLLLGWAYCCAVALTARHYLAARRAALAAFYDPDDTEPDIEPPSLDLALKELNQANVVFAEAESSPFLGSGSEIDHWALTIDLSRGSTGSSTSAGAVVPGSRSHQREHSQREHKQPDAFTGADLQEYLMTAVPEVVQPRPASGHRLHVRGGTTAPIVDLFRSGPLVPDLIDAMRFRRPVTRVSPEVIQRYLNEPNEAARVYTYFQHSAWGGQVVITLFVRALVSNRTLFVEGRVYALRPLVGRFYEVRGLSQRRWVELSQVLRQARANALALLVASPNRVRRAMQNPLRPIEVRRIDREIHGRRDLDFGANHTLREQFAAHFDPGDHFPAMDERMYHQIFNRRVLECIGEFLAAKNIDTVEFAHQQASIVNRAVYLGDLYGPLNRSGQPGEVPPPGADPGD